MNRRGREFDITVLLEETKDGVSGQVEYRTDLFEGETIRRLIDHWARWLTGALAAPARRLWALPLLSAAEWTAVVETPNATARPYPATPLHGWFEAQVARTPDAVAVVDVDGVRTLTFAELEGWANQLAHALRARGVGPEVVVGVALARSMDLVIALLGILKAGGAYLPLDPAWPGARVSTLLETLAVPVVVTETAALSALAAALPAGVREVVCVDAPAEPAAARTQTPGGAAISDVRDWGRGPLTPVAGDGGCRRAGVCDFHLGVERRAEGRAGPASRGKQS